VNRLIDILNFRTYDEDENYTDKPQITVGSIVLGVLLRLFILLIASLFVFKYFPVLYDNTWVLLLAIWFLVIYPAYRGYTNYYKRIDKMQSSTLCGSCKHFEHSSQLCRVYDEHVSQNHIPCEGDSWEPK